MDKSLMLNKIMEHKGFRTKTEFADFLGISTQNLAVWFKRDTFNSNILFDKLPELNPTWLLTGEGDMLITDTTPQIVLAKTREQNLVPFFDDVDTIGGNGRVRADVDTAYGVSNAEMIDAGDWFRGATAAIRHYGDSMVEYPSGSILAVKRITDYRTIISGKSYVVETSDFRVTKQLQDINEEYLIAYSTNTETYPDGRLIHAPFKIYKDVIRHIDLVLGCVTIEQGARYNLRLDIRKKG